MDDSWAGGRAMINGDLVPLADAVLPLTDEGVTRGDGGFETIGVWDGRPFMLDEHLARLRASLDAIGLPAPDLDLLITEVERLIADHAADGALRVYITASGTRVLTVTGPPDRPALRRLVSQSAPWIRPLGSYGPAGAKTMSYGPNMAATRAARRMGADDALLIALEGYVLEGSTFSVMWVIDDTLRVPALSLGIVDSISRRALLGLAGQLGLRVAEGRWMVSDLEDAKEVLACSSVRGLEAVERIDHLRFDGARPIHDEFARLLTDLRRGA